MNTSIFTASSYPPSPFPSLHTHKHTADVSGGGGIKIVVRMVVKSKIGKLEEEVMEEFSIRERKELTGVFQ